jgi:hypothetical protein
MMKVAAGVLQAFGPNLVTNGGFDTDASGWSSVRATLASVSGGRKALMT